MLAGRTGWGGVEPRTLAQAFKKEQLRHVAKETAGDSPEAG
jgi:hypothetical protein